MKNSEFILGNVPITKEEVRAISISKLKLNNASAFLDVGSGTGSVTVEAALLNRNLKVISIEKNTDAYNLTKKNIEKFGLKNVILIHEEAPLQLKSMKFDSVFMGGSGKNLKEIISWVYEILNDGGIFVSNFILFDNFYRTLEYLRETGFKDVKAVQVSVNSFEKLGGGSYFKPQNPVFIVSAEK